MPPATRGPGPALRPVPFPSGPLTPGLMALGFGALSGTVLEFHAHCLMTLRVPGGARLPTCPPAPPAESQREVRGWSPSDYMAGPDSVPSAAHWPPVVGGCMGGPFLSGGCWLQWTPLPGLWVGGSALREPWLAPCPGFLVLLLFPYAAFD